jgi:hypothetical protein
MAVHQTTSPPLAMDLNSWPFHLTSGISRPLLVDSMRITHREDN